MKEADLDPVLPLILILPALVTPLFLGVFVTRATWIPLIRWINLDPLVSLWWWHLSGPVSSL
jgi:hypothetical protein